MSGSRTDCYCASEYPYLILYEHVPSNISYTCIIRIPNLDFELNLLYKGKVLKFSFQNHQYSSV